VLVLIVDIGDCLFGRQVGACDLAGIGAVALAVDINVAPERQTQEDAAPACADDTGTFPEPRRMSISSAEP